MARGMVTGYLAESEFVVEIRVDLIPGSLMRLTLLEIDTRLVLTGTYFTGT